MLSNEGASSIFGSVAHLGLGLVGVSWDMARERRALRAVDMLLTLLRNDRRFDLAGPARATSKSSSRPCSRLPYMSHRLSSSPRVVRCRSGVELNRVSVLPSSGGCLGEYWSDSEKPLLSLSPVTSLSAPATGAGGVVMQLSGVVRGERPQLMGMRNLIGPQ